MDDLIGKVLAGEASATEIAAVEEWIAQSEANLYYYNQLKTIFQKAASANVEVQFDADAAWNTVRRKIVREGKQVILPEAQGPSRLALTLRIAAGILIAITVGYYGWSIVKPPVSVHEAVAGPVLVTDTLPDGSKAFLNHRSKLTYTYDPGKKTRAVKLTGEAFFEVVHAEYRPFIIEAEEVLIEDIGTSFNVNAYPETNTVEVVVEEGEVQIYTLSNPGLALKAGEKGVYDKTLKAFSKVERIDTNVLAYKTKVFRFNNTDLRSVVALINSIYDVHITLSDEALNNCRLTVNFNNDKLDTIIEVLSETMGLTVDKKDAEIILRGTGCSN